MFSTCFPFIVYIFLYFIYIKYNIFSAILLVQLGAFFIFKWRIFSIYLFMRKTWMKIEQKYFPIITMTFWYINVHNMMERLYLYYIFLFVYSICINLWQFFCEFLSIAISIIYKIKLSHNHMDGKGIFKLDT